MNVSFPCPGQFIFDLYYGNHKLNNHIPQPKKPPLNKRIKHIKWVAVYKYVDSDQSLAQFDTWVVLFLLPLYKLKLTSKFHRKS